MMDFKSIYETLRYSADYVEFMINYNELIPDIVAAKKKDLRIYTYFIGKKNELKNDFYDKFCIEYKSRYVRQLAESKYICDIDVSEYLKDFEPAVKKINKFKKLF